VVKPMPARVALKRLRQHAKRRGWIVEEAKDPRGRSRGKGAHMIYLVIDKKGIVCGRVNLPQHSGDMSVGVTRSTEAGLGRVCGKGWLSQ